MPDDGHPSILGKCDEPINANIPFRSFEVSFSASGLITTVTPRPLADHPENIETKTVEIHFDPASGGDSGILDGDEYTKKWETRRKYYRASSITDLGDDEFLVRQDTCCCAGRWTLYFRDIDSDVDPGEVVTLFSRGPRDDLGFSTPRMKIVTTVTNSAGGTPTVTTTTPDIELTIQPQNGSTPPCRRKKRDGSEWTPAFDLEWNAAFVFSFLLTAGFQTGDGAMRTRTINGGEPEVIEWDDTEPFTPAEIGELVNTKPWLSTQEWSVEIADHSEVTVGGQTSYVADINMAIRWKASE